jgi:hypothetical protein
MPPMVEALKKKVAAEGRVFAIGFVTGLAQAVSVTGAPSSHKFPRTDRSAAEALRGDWERLGKDMRRAVEKAAPRGAR